jgi:hypothetical protein
MFDSVNRTCFPKEDHLPDCASRENQVKKGDCVEMWRPKFGHEMLVNRITQHGRTRLRTRLQSAAPADYSYQIADGCAV